MKNQKKESKIIDILSKLVIPVLIFIGGYFIQNKFFKNQEKVEKLKISRSILNDMFETENFDKKIAMKSILNQLTNEDESLSEFKKQLDIIIKNEIFNSEKEVGEKLIRKVKNSSNKEYLNLEIEKYKKVIKLEEEGFYFLLKRNFKEALKKFEEIEKIYPTFHQAYEICNYLKNNSSNDKNNVLKNIIEKYSWKAPKKIVREIQHSLNK
ncbi:hypothetical protein [Pasteurella atlantica]|uniref:hypothetical protein n=1 Tax=Pasteurellaceae TaxID=712 RepID=UPI002764497A|nr:hypothetical protein [Pasteurella atlantica]MDP8098491.1 hypothetical protein [Pasteurella atlantica]MDP8106395.1 hypothetical protein [Pasteurella atlantica]MDP8116294.1 hypothetical protein [Pasteurella atlantica]